MKQIVMIQFLVIVLLLCALFVISAQRTQLAYKHLELQKKYIVLGYKYINLMQETLKADSARLIKEGKIVKQ